MVVGGGLLMAIGHLLVNLSLSDEYNQSLYYIYIC